MNQIHYSIHTEDDGVTWDGQTPCPPAVGDFIVVDGKVLQVRERVWEDAESTLGAEEARAWGHGAGDHVSLTLVCAITSMEKSDVIKVSSKETSAPKRG